MTQFAENIWDLQNSNSVPFSSNSDYTYGDNKTYFVSFFAYKSNLFTFIVKSTFFLNQELMLCEAKENLHSLKWNAFFDEYNLDSSGIVSEDSLYESR